MILFQVERHDSELHRPCSVARTTRLCCVRSHCPEEVSTASAVPSGSGFQLSLYGLFGILLREGLEVNLLGLSLGVDPVRPALKLPALGRLGMAGL